MSIDYSSLCHPVEKSVDYMAILIAGEALLLVVVVAKLAYDIWNYQKTGEMPWMARIICCMGGGGGNGNSGDAKDMCCCCFRSNNNKSRFDKQNVVYLESSVLESVRSL